MAKFGAKDNKRKGTNGVIVDLDAKGGPKFVSTDPDKETDVNKRDVARKFAGKKLEKPSKANEKLVAKSKGKPAAKAAKGKAAPKAERAPREADVRKIKLLVKENPKREGSSSYDRFELYRGSKTVADFVAKGGSVADVRYDEAKGYIQVA